VGPRAFRVLEQAYYVDALYTATLVRANGWWAGVCDWFDRFVWNGVVQMVRFAVLGLAWLDNLFDTYVVNAGFDEGCREVSRGGRLLARLQVGRVQGYLRMIGLALVALALWLLWGAKA
jgi:NADH-quinone oxidoreductase subunit L